jgi:hypothetical protein
VKLKYAPFLSLFVVDCSYSYPCVICNGKKHFNVNAMSEVKHKKRSGFHNRLRKKQRTEVDAKLSSAMSTFLNKNNSKEQDSKQDEDGAGPSNPDMSFVVQPVQPSTSLPSDCDCDPSPGKSI